MSKSSSGTQAKYCLIAVSAATFVLYLVLGLIGCGLWCFVAGVDDLLPFAGALPLLLAVAPVSIFLYFWQRRRTAHICARRLSFKQRLFIAGVVSFTAFAVGTTTSGFIRRERVQELSNARKLMKAIGDLKAGQIHSWRAEHLSDALLLKNQHLIEGDLQEFLSDPSGERKKEDVLRWLAFYKQGNRYAMASLLDSSGKTRLQINDEHPLPLSIPEESLDSENVFISDLHRTGEDADVHLDVIIPIFKAERRPLLARVVLSIDVRRVLFPMIQSWPVPSETAETLMIRREGDSVLFLNDLRHHGQAALRLRSNINEQGLVNTEGLPGFPGEAEGNDYRGVPVIAAIRAVPETPWLVVAKVDLAEVLDDLLSEAWMTLALTSLLVIVSGLGSSLFIRRRAEQDVRRELAHQLEVGRLALLYATLSDINKSIVRTQSEEELFTRVCEIFAAYPGCGLAWIGRYNREQQRVEILAAAGEAKDCVKDLNIEVSKEAAKLSPTAGAMLSSRPCIKRDIVIESASAGCRLVAQKYGQKSFAAFPIVIEGHVWGSLSVCSSEIAAFQNTEIELLEEAAADIAFALQSLFHEKRHREAELAFRESRERYRSLFDNMLEGASYNRMIFENGVPVDFLYLDTNPAFEKLTGLQNAAGKRVTEVIPGIRERDPQLFEIYGRVVQTGEPERFEAYVESLKKWFSVSVYHANNDEFVTVFDNITAQKQTQLAIEDHERYLNAILRSTRDGFYVVGIDGRYLEMNDAFCALTGYSRAELFDMYLHEIEALESPAEIAAHVERVLAEGADRFESQFRRKDGTIVDVEQSVNFLDKHGGRIVCFARDITERKNADKQRRNLWRAVEQNPASIVITDAQRVVEYVNPKFTAVTGYAADEIVGRDVNILRSWKTPDQDHERVWETLRAGGDCRGEYWSLKKNGESYLESAIISPIKDENGDIAHYVAVKEDISERKQLESERENMMRLLRVLNSPGNLSSLIGDVSFLLSETFRCEDVTISLETGNGHDLSAALAAAEGAGAPFFTSRRSFWSNNLSKLPGEVFENAALLRTLNRGGYESVARIALRAGSETIAWLQLGDRAPEVFTLRGINLLERMADALAVGLAHRRTMSHLETSEERYRLLFESGYDSVFLAPIEDGLPANFIEVNENACRRLGYSREQLLQMSPFDIDPALNKSAMEELVVELINKGGMCFSTTHRASDGRHIPVEISAQVLDYQGKKMALSIARDVSDRRRAEEAMRQSMELAQAAARVKSEFLANMSHEIRTPMNGIVGMADLALGTPLSFEQKQYIETIRSSADMLLVILNDILDFSRIEAGKLPIVAQPFDFRHFVSRTLNILSSRIKAKRLHFVRMIDESIPKILIGDDIRLGQVMINLVGNAVKFTPHGGEVVLSIEAVQAAGEENVLVLHFIVTDTGVGIPSDKIKQIFEPFVQVDASTTREFGGTGLGLSISNRLVDMMGGKLWVESNVGAGSAFHFTLRMGVGHELPLAGKKAPTGASPRDVAANSNVKVLLVEDNAVNQKVATAILQKRGFEVEVAANGKEALERLTDPEAPPMNLVLMDVQMPVMDGYETTRIIRERERGGSARLPIIALTAHALAGDRSKCLEAGMDDYVAKPVVAEELVSVVERWARKTAKPRKEETKLAQAEA